MPYTRRVSFGDVVVTLFVFWKHWSVTGSSPNGDMFCERCEAFCLCNLVTIFVLKSLVPFYHARACMSMVVVKINIVI